MISGQGVIDHPAATRHPPVVYELHYEFQGWLVGDVVESFPPILVTRRLADAIEQERLTGADFDEAKVTTTRSLSASIHTRPTRYTNGDG